MIICSSSNIDLIQGVTGYGTVSDGATDWRIENTPTGVFNILNSPNLLAPNVSIIDVGNVGIGTIPITGTNKLQVQGAASVSGLITANAGITVNTGSLTCANDTISKTYTATNTTAGANDILTMRYDTTNGIRFCQTLVAANDVRYDLIQKTNNVDYTAPVISFYKGNVGIGTNNPNTSYKLNVTGDVNISGGYFVGGSAFTIPYFNLTNKITAGNGIALTTGSASMSPTISTNLTAGNGISISAVASPVISTNLTAGSGISISAAASPTISANISAGSGITFTPSGNNISISAGASSQWTGATGANIYYNSANVGIGTATIQSSYKLQVQGNSWVENQLVFNNSYRGGGGTDYACNKISIYGGGNTPTTSSSFGFGMSSEGLEYFSGGNHRFYTGTVGGTSYGTPTLYIASGNVAIGTDATGSYKLNVNGSINSTSILVNGTAIASQVQSNWTATSGISSILNKPTIPSNLWQPNGSHAYFDAGNVGIGTNNPVNIFQVGSGGRLRIANSSSDYTTIGTNDLDDATNTRIYLQGRGYITTGQISYHTSSTGSHVFYTTDSGTERMRIHSSGILSIGTTVSDGASLIVASSIKLVAAGAVIFFGNSTENQIYRNSINGSLIFVTGNTDNRAVIKSNGYFGIGIADPQYPLHVNSAGVSNNLTGARYLDQSGVSAVFSGDYSGIVARFIGAVLCGYCIVTSDIRIKKDIEDIIDDSALQMILAIEPKTYKYIDILERNNNKVYGFIAQQIKEVIPEAVKIDKSYIPNIYLVADYTECVITLTYQPTKVIIKVNDKIKCYDKENKEIFVEVIEIIDDLTFRIKELEKEYTDTKIFVYGTFVDDLHTLNKDYIFTLNVCATQELHRRIEAQNIVIKSQDDRIKDLEAKVEMLLNNM
jgi:hypothetical protein